MPAQLLTHVRIQQIDVLQEGLVRIDPIKSFDNAGLHPAMLRNVQLCGYHVPTPIQRYCIPAITQGYDVIAIAQTGRSSCHLFPLEANAVKVLARPLRILSPSSTI